MPDSSISGSYDHSGVSSYWLHIWVVKTHLSARVRTFRVAEGFAIFDGRVVEVAQNNQRDWGVQAGEHHGQGHYQYGEESHEQEGEWHLQDICNRFTREQTSYHRERRYIHWQEWDCAELGNYKHCTFSESIHVGYTLVLTDALVECFK